MIKQDSILALKEKLDILDIIKDYFPNPKRSGRNYFVHCPFHNERTASFSISPEKKIVHCFGCGYNGDIIKFVQDMEHVTYFEAVEKIAKKINFVLEYSHYDKEKYNEKKILLELLDEVSFIYNEILLKDKIAAGARRYLALRGITPGTIEKFRLGFAPDGNYITTNFKKYDLSTLYKAGLINFRQPNDDKEEIKKYDHPYDYFRDRIIFPVINLSGNVVSFGGRILPGSIYSVKENVPTYLNGPETIVFNKGTSLYGLFQGKDEIVKKQTVNIVEGYMDTLMLHQEGFCNTVAPLGTSLTEAQVRVLKRFTENICIIFDPDQSGRSATISAAQTVFKCDLFPQTVLLPDNTDPDEYILQHGRQKFYNLVSTPYSIVKFIVDHYLKLLDKDSVKNLDTKERINLLKKVIETLNTITNPVVKSDVIKETAERLSVNEELLRSEIKKYFNKNLACEESFEQTQRPYSCEEELLYLCLHNPQLMNEIPDEIFDHNQEFMDTFKKIKETYFRTNDISQVIDELQSPMKETVIRMIFDTKEIYGSLEQKVARLFEDISKAKHIKRYKELKPIITKMLEGSCLVDQQKLNEFKQLVEILKKRYVY